MESHPNLFRMKANKKLGIALFGSTLTIKCPPVMGIIEIYSRLTLDMNPGKAFSRFGSGFPFEGGEGLRDKGTQIGKKGSKGLIQVTIKLLPMGCKPFLSIMGLQVFEKRKGLWKKTLKPLNRKR
jgi:hypothetical protein